MNTFAQHELPDGNSIRMGFVPDNLLMTQEPLRRQTYRIQLRNLVYQSILK